MDKAVMDVVLLGVLECVAGTVVLLRRTQIAAALIAGVGGRVSSSLAVAAIVVCVTVGALLILLVGISVLAIAVVRSLT